MSAPLSPLNDLDRLTGLTRRYADYGSRKAGLIGVLGGLLLALSSGLGSGWWHLHRASGPAIAASGSGSWRVFLFETEKLPLWVVLPVWATPLVFLAISAVLRRRVYQPLGPVKAVDNTPVPPNPQILWSCFAAVVGTMLLGFALVALFITFAITLHYQGEGVWGVPAEITARYLSIRQQMDLLLGFSRP